MSNQQLGDDEEGGPVIHPKHYNMHPSGVECIDVVEHMPFNVGTAVKYLWRCGEKGSRIQDLRKALWYVQREIDKELADEAAAAAKTAARPSRRARS